MNHRKLRADYSGLASGQQNFIKSQNPGGGYKKGVCNRDGNTDSVKQAFTCTGVVSLLVMVLFLCGLPIGVSVAAEPVKNMSTVRVWVPNSSTEARMTSLSSALSAVFVRITGTDRVLKANAVKAALEVPESYLISYVYEQATPLELQNRRYQGLSEAGLWLKLRFDEQFLTNFLRNQGLPVWGNPRPLVLFWWGQDAEGLRGILAEDDSVSPLAQAAHVRGLPLKLPRLDQEDLNYGVEAAVFGLVSDTVMPASERYAADAVVIGYGKKMDENVWFGDWQLVVNGEHYLFEEQSSSLENLSAKVVNSVAEQLAALYSVVSDVSSVDHVDLRVVSVPNFTAYRGIQKYLQHLNVVKGATLEHIQGDRLLYRIALDGSIEQFKKTLALDNRLVPKRSDFDNSNAGINHLGDSDFSPNRQPTSTTSVLDPLQPVNSEGLPMHEPATIPASVLEYYWVEP